MPAMYTELHTDEAVRRLAAARPMLVDVRPAGEVVPHHAAGGITHGGPPIESTRMCPPMRRAIGGALAIEGVAPDADAALALVDAGEVPYVPNHDVGGVGPMSGVVTASMPLLVARDEATGALYTSSLIALGLILFVITFAVLALAKWLLARAEVK